MIHQPFNKKSDVKELECKNEKLNTHRQVKNSKHSNLAGNKKSVIENYVVVAFIQGAMVRD